MRKPFLLWSICLCFGALAALSGAAAQGAPDAAGGAEVEKRLQRLEEQIVDLSAQLGTIESMSQSGGGAVAAPSAGFSGGGDSGGGGDVRLLEIETQVRALSSQMGEILRRLDQIERRSGSVSPSLQPGENDGGNFGALPSDGTAQPAEQGTGFSVGGNQPANEGFGATIEPRPANSAAARGGLSGYFEPESSGAGAANGAAPVQTAERSSPEARNLYQKAYNALVQRNYRAASEDFGQFVQSFPNDPLAGPAYFWLGEAAFVNGEYRQAADSFLKSSTNYPGNEKAAESLLKLGISLKRLGENQAACSSFAELARRFPSATPVLQRAERERSRTQC